MTRASTPPHSGKLIMGILALIAEFEIQPRLQFAYPGGLKWGPCTSLTRCSLGCTPKCPIDTGLAELGTPYDFRDGRTISPQGFHLLNHGECQYRLGSKPNASRLGLIDSILLALAANIVLELGNQRQDAHDKLAGARACIDRGIVEHLELNAPLRQFGDNAIKVGGRTGQAVELCDHERVAFPQILEAGFERRPSSINARALFLEYLVAARKLFKLHC